MRPAKQPVGPDDEHNCHHQKFRDQRKLGKIDGRKTEIDNTDADAYCFHFGDDHGGQIGTGYRAHPADHHNHEGVPDRDQIGGKVRRLARDLQSSAEPGKCRTKRKNRREQNRLVDAKRAHHFAILRRGPHQPAEARAREREMQHEQHKRANDDQKQIVSRQTTAKDFD